MAADTLMFDDLRLLQKLTYPLYYRFSRSKFLLFFSGPVLSTPFWLNRTFPHRPPTDRNPTCSVVYYASRFHAQLQPSSKHELHRRIITQHEKETSYDSIVQPIRRPDLFSALGIVTACGVMLWALLESGKVC
jgi:hypothetical protein